jgi:hypothetical protein
LTRDDSAADETRRAQHVIHRSRSAGRRHAVRAAALAAVVALALSGCGTDLQPGVAAKVRAPSADDATSITQSHVDDVTRALCGYLKTGGSGNQLPVAVARSNTALNYLVFFNLMDALADERGLTMRPSDVASGAAQFTVPDAMSGDDRDILTQFFDDFAKASLQQATLAANLQSGQTTSAGVDISATSGAEPTIKAYFDKADVEINPADGVWDGFNVTAASGSLSDPVSSAAAAAKSAIDDNDVSNLPPSQVCG